MHAARVSASDNIDSMSAFEGKMNNAGFPDSKIDVFLVADNDYSSDNDLGLLAITCYYGILLFLNFLIE